MYTVYNTKTQLYWVPSTAVHKCWLIGPVQNVLFIHLQPNVVIAHHNAFEVYMYLNSFGDILMVTIELWIVMRMKDYSSTKCICDCSAYFYHHSRDQCHNRFRCSVHFRSYVYTIEPSHTKVEGVRQDSFGDCLLCGCYHFGGRLGCSSNRYCRCNCACFNSVKTSSNVR